MTSEWPRPPWPTNATLAAWAEQLTVIWFARAHQQDHPKGKRRRSDWPHVTRYCFDCCKRKPLTEFRKNATDALGHERRCKACRGT